MVDIGFVLQRRMRLELACLLWFSFFSLLLVMLNDGLMVLFWFSWLDFFEVKWLGNCLMSILSFPGLEKKHLIVMKLLKIWNTVSLALYFMILRILFLQFFLSFSNIFIVILKVLHGGRKACALQQFCGSFLFLCLITCSYCLRLICGLWNGPGVEGSIPIVVIIHLLGFLIISNRQIEQLCNSLCLYCGFWSLFGRFVCGWRNWCCVKYYLFLLGLFDGFSCYLINDGRLF